MSDYPRSTVSTINGVNAETQKIQTAVNSKIDKSGGAFTGTVDMNEQRLINLPDAIDPSEPLPLGQGLAIQEAAEDAADRAEAAAVSAEAAAAAAIQYPEGVLAAALSAGTADVGGETSGALARKYAENPALSDTGAVGDSITNQDDEVSAVLATPQKSIDLPAGRYLVTDVSNALGKEFTGNGRLVKAVTGGLEAQNTYADLYQRVTGQEYLAAWYKNVWFQTITPSRELRIVFSGDSTTDGGVGNGVNNGFNIWELVPQGIYNRGLQGAYGTIGINRGQSGANTQQWVDNFVAGDIAASGDLYVLRWGINDPGWLKNGTTPPIDSGQSYPNRRDVNDFATSLRAGLTLMRASLPFESVSILLMMPNSTYDIPNARDALWYEQLRDVYVQAARDFNCAFIDTYAIMQDSRKLFNILMDDPMPTSGRGIHPNDAMNSIIAGHICELLAPEGFKYRFSSNRVLSTGGPDVTPETSLSPSAYQAAIYLSRSLTSQGWPVDGSSITINSSDKTTLQFHHGYKAADAYDLYFRTGRAASLEGEAEGFNAMVKVSAQRPKEVLAAGTGFQTPSGGNLVRLARSGDQVVIDGSVDKTVPSTLTLNQIVAAYSGSNGPLVDSAHGFVTVFSGSAFEQLPAYIGVDGNVRVAKASTLSATRVYVSIHYNL